MVFNIENIINKIAVLIAAFLLLIIGFYFGYKFDKSNDVVSSGVVSAQVEYDDVDSIDWSEIETKDLELLVFPDPKDEGACPNTHRIKGKIDGQIRKYYLPDNKFYERVTAHICFAKPTDAETNGFIKQY